MRVLAKSELKAVTGGQSVDCEALAAHIDTTLAEWYSYCGGTNPSDPWYGPCSSWAWEIQQMIDYYNANC